MGACWWERDRVDRYSAHIPHKTLTCSASSRCCSKVVIAGSLSSDVELSLRESDPVAEPTVGKAGREVSI